MKRQPRLDDAPEWPDEMFERAEIRRGEQILRPARGTMMTSASSVAIDGGLRSAQPISGLNRAARR